MLIIILFSISASFAAEADDNLQAVDETGTEPVSLSDESTDDSLQSEENANENQGASLVGGAQDNDNDQVISKSYEEDIIKDGEKGNWTELATVLNYKNDTNLTKDYVYQTRFSPGGAIYSGSISISFYPKVIDGQGHSIDFTSDHLGGTNEHGSIYVSHLEGLTFKNIVFINASIQCFQSSYSSFINCTFIGSAGLSFSAANYCRIENCTFNYTNPGYHGGIRFGGKHVYDGPYENLEGNNNTILNCKFINLGLSSGSGGALQFCGGDNNIINSTFINCTIADVSNYEHDPTTLISGNPVKYVKSGGGAILFNGPGNNVVGCNFTDCWTKFKGGVIYFIEGNNTVSDCNFEMTQVPDYAVNVTSKTGAIYFDSNDGNTIQNSTFTNFEKCESVIYAEGALNVTGSTFTNNSANTILDLHASGNNIDQSTFDGNTALNGGALTVSNSTITNCNFTNNHATQSGGAIYYGGNTVIDNCNFINNSAANGGAIACNGTSNNTINNSLFLNNTASEKGGAIYLGLSDNSNILNSHFENNTAQTGTAIYVEGEDKNENIVNSTFAVTKQDCEVEILIDLVNSQINVQFLPPDDYLLGVKVIDANVQRENLSYVVNGQKISVEDPSIENSFVNKAITLELYDEDGNLIGNSSEITDADGLVYFDGAKIFSDIGAARYLKAYHTEDKYFYYAEDDDYPEVGDFDKLQFLVNHAGENGVVNLNRNYTYTLGLDTITEGVVIRYNNITVNGNGYTINALNQSRIFKVIGDDSKLINLGFTNAVDGALYYDDVASALIDNAVFTNNQGTDGTIYFTGGDLTLSNSEIINSTTAHMIYKTFRNTAYSGYYENHEGTGLLYAYSNGRICISNTKFRNSTFGMYGAYIVADEVVLDNVESEGNLALYEYFEDKYVKWGQYSSQYRYEPIKHEYSGYYPQYDDEGRYLDGAYVMFDINADNVEISNASSTKDTVGTFIYINGENTTVEDLKAINSTLRSAIIVKGDLAMDSVEIDNVNGDFTIYDHNYYTSEDTYRTGNYYGNVIYADNVDEGYITDSETGDWIYYSHITNDVSIKNVIIKNMDSADSEYEYILIAGAVNLTMENVTASNYTAHSTLIYVQSNNSDVSNIKVEDSDSYIHNNILSARNLGNFTLSDVSLKNFQLNPGCELISIYGDDNDLNHSVIVDSLLFENLIPNDYNYTYTGYSAGSWQYSHYGFRPIELGEDSADITLSDIIINDCYISNGIRSYSKTLKVNNIAVSNSSVSDNRNILNFDTDDDLILEGVLIDNIKVDQNIDISYDARSNNYYINENIPDIAAGITASSRNGNLKANNINLTNIESLAPNMLMLGAYGNVTIGEVNLKNISEPDSITVQRNVNNSLYNDYYTGIAHNSIVIMSLNGTVEISDMSIDEIASGVADAREYNKYYMNITGVNVTVNDLSINNAGIGGFVDGKTIIFDAVEYLNVNNLLFNNITSADAYNHTYYNSTLDMVMYECYISPGTSGIFMTAGKNATVADVKITNTLGGTEYGSLIIEAENVTLSDILIDNLTTFSGAGAIYYNEEFGNYVKESNKGLKYEFYSEYNEEYDETLEGYRLVIDSNWHYSSPGLNIESDNVVVDNLNITNCRYGADLGEEMNLIELECENATLSNVRIYNITEKPGIKYSFYQTPIFEEFSGRISPRMQLEVADQFKLYNLTVEDVESGCFNTEFIYIYCGDGDIQNVSIKDSAIGAYDGPIEIEADNNLTIRNFTVDNISGALPYNETETVDYYTYRWGDYYYAFSETYYEAESYVGFSVSMYASNIDISDMSITNIISGGEEGTLSIEGENITVNNLLLENISSTPNYNEEYEPAAHKYLINYEQYYKNGGLFIEGNGGNAVLTNVRLNNIDIYNKVFEVENGNVTMENVTISNINQVPMIDYDYDDDYNMYIEEIEYGGLDLISIYAYGGVADIKNLVVDNVPCGENTVTISGGNVSISESVFKNMISGVANYDYNETSKQLYLTQYTNCASGVVVAGANVTVSDTLFENIALGGTDNHMGKALVISNANDAIVNNCTFANIHSIQGNETYFDGNSYETYLYDCNGSAIEFASCSHASIISSEFTNCSADIGGVLYLESPVDIINSTFLSNRANYGGAVYISKKANGVNIYNSTFILNLAEFNGGAIYILEPANETHIINESTFIGNRANHDGGAFFYNNTYDGVLFDDYEWFNRTAMFSDGLLSYTQPKTQIINSEFENNTDHSLLIIANDVANDVNQTVIITINVDCDGDVTVNITDEQGNFIYDLNGNEVKNMNYKLVNGTVSIPLGVLANGKYNVSAYHNNYHSQYDEYHNYAYHYNSTTFNVCDAFLNVTANATYVDENVTITAEMLVSTVGTVNITISNSTTTLTFNNVPIVNGIAQVNVTGLWAGDYKATVKYSNNLYNSTLFTVYLRDPVMNVSVKGNVYKNTTVLVVEVPKNQTGNITVRINNQTFVKEVTNGTVEFEVGNLNAGSWQANITFNETKVYRQNTTVFDFTVAKANLTAEVIGNNVTIRDNSTFIINVDDDFKGNVTITIDGKTYYDGPVSDIVTISRLDAGEYNATAHFYGDSNYNDADADTNFTVEFGEPYMDVSITDTIYTKNATATITVTGNANGTVIITVDGKNYTGTVTNGQASVQLDNLTGGVKEATAKFITSSEKILNTTANATFTVHRINSTLIITNETTNVVVLVPNDASGNVTIYVNEKAYVREISGGKAVVEDILLPGETSIVAIYDGDRNYNGTVNSTSIIIPVVKLNTTVIITNESTNVIVTVHENATGNITVYVNGVKFVRQITGGKVTVDDVLVPGENYIVAIYDGDENFTSAENSTTLIISKKQASVNVTADPITYGMDAEIIVKVGPGQKGYVTISVANKTYTSEIKSSEIIFTIPNLNATVTPLNVTVIYSGDGEFDNVTNSTTLVVNKADLTASVEAQNVTVNDNTSFVIYDIPADFNGYVNITIREDKFTGEVKSLIHMLKLPVGTYTANVTFYGDNNYNDLELNTTFTVSRVEGTVMTVIVDNVDYPNNATAIINITGNANGTVTVNVDGVVYDPVSVENGQAVVELGRLSAGIKEITANFTATDSINTNATAKSKFLINKANSTITIENKTTDIIINITGGASGNVTVYINGVKEVIPFTGELINLTGVLHTGNNTIVVEFIGNENYTSAQKDKTVEIPKQSALVNVTADPITYGDEAKIIVTVGEGQSGYVTITVNSRQYTAEIKDKQVIFTVLGLNATTHDVTVTYSGDVNFNNETNSTKLTVNKADLTATVEGVNVTVLDNASFIIHNIPSDFKGYINITVDSVTYTRSVDSVVEIAKLSQGTKTAKVLFWGDNNYNDLPLEVNFTVSRVQDTTVTVSVESVVYSNNAYANITVSGKANGTVKVYVEGVECGNGIVTDGHAMVDLGVLSAGAKNVIANFTVIDDINVNATGSTSFIVKQADSHVYIAVNGKDINITATANGNITVYVNGVKVNESVFTGSPICLVGVLHTGNNTVLAVFSGNENYTGSQNDTESYIPRKSSSVNVTADAITYGADARIIVNVGEGQTGYVTIKVADKHFTEEINATQIVFTVPGLNATSVPLNVTVTYSGDGEFENNTNYTDLTVNKADLTATVEGLNVTVLDNTSFVISGVPSDFHGYVNITLGDATYSGDAKSLIHMNKLPSGTYTANVTFYGDNNYNDLKLNASFTVSRISEGGTTLNVTVSDVVYSNNATALITFSGNANGTVVVTVDGKEYAPVEVKNGLAEVDLGVLSAGVKNVTAKFTVTDLINANATGSTRFTVKQANSSVIITFNNTDVTIQVVPGETGKLLVVINGAETEYTYTAPITIENVLKVGKNTVVAFYEGSENYTLSEANENTTIPHRQSSVNATAQNTTYGNPVEITVTVPVNQTGYVTITVNGENHTEAIKDGKAVFSITGLKVKQYNVTVTYLGDENYASQTNTTVFSVTKADLPGSVIAENVTVQQNTEFIVTVPADFTGKVNITVDGITYSGSAKSLITMDKLTAGDKTAKVVFFEDDNYNDLELNATFTVSDVIAPITIIGIKSDNMTRGYNSPYDYQAAFLDSEGNALKNTEVAFKVNGKEYKVKTNEDGIAQLTSAKLAVGTYNITSINPVTGEEVVNEVKIVKRITGNKDLVMDFTDGSVFKVKVFGDDGKVAPAGEIIDITANGVHYVAKVDKNGYAGITINLLPKKYTITAEYKGYKTTNKLTVKQILKPVKKTIKVKKGKKITIKAKLKWSNGKAIKGKKITFKFKGKTYKAKTNKKGIAKVVIKKKKVLKKLKKGKKYTVKITYAVKQKYGNSKITIKDTVKCKVKIKK